MSDEPLPNSEKVFTDNELLEDSVIRNFRITAADEKTYDRQD